MVVVDPNLTDSETLSVTLSSLRDEGIDTAVFDQVRIEPTDVSFERSHRCRRALRRLRCGGRRFDYRHVQGGESVRYLPGGLHGIRQRTHRPGNARPRYLAPMVAIPTTAGTGSETTGVAIFDLAAMHAKTGFAHRALRPRLGLIDPDNTRQHAPYGGRLLRAGRLLSRAGVGD